MLAPTAVKSCRKSPVTSSSSVPLLEVVFLRSPSRNCFDDFVLQLRRIDIPPFRKKEHCSSTELVCVFDFLRHHIFQSHGLPLTGHLEKESESRICWNLLTSSASSKSASAISSDEIRKVLGRLQNLPVFGSLILPDSAKPRGGSAAFAPSK